MKKNLKYLSLGLLVILAAFAAYLLLSGKISFKQGSQADAKQAARKAPIVYVASSTLIDPSVMTVEEKNLLHVSSDLNVEVVERNASGTPTVYRIIK